MNRTVAFLSLAGGLALLALVLAVPRSAPTSTTSTTTVKPPDPVVTPILPKVNHTPTESGSLHMEGRLSHPVVGTGASDVFMTVDLKGVEVPGADRAPVNIAVVIDRSGSMYGEKLDQAKQSARHLVQQLRETDRLSIVHYGSDVKALPGMMATPENKQRMLRYISRITDDGGTNIGAGLQNGKWQVAQQLGEFKVNRIILISDGQPTEGITDGSALMRLTRGIRGQGVSVSSIGIGTDFNENVMQGIAEYGAGAYAYLRDASMLATIFQKDLQQAGTTVARDVELSFDLPEGVELGDVLGYRHSRAGRTVRIPMTDFSAGQVERVVVRLRVNGAQAGKSIDVAKLELAYSDLLADKAKNQNVMLAALVSDQQEEIDSKRDKEAVLFAARARAAANTTRAADMMAKGRSEEAEKLMQQNQAIFSEAAAVAGAPAVAQDMAAQEEMSDGLLGAATRGDTDHQVKAAKAKALKDFGRMGSTY